LRLRTASRDQSSIDDVRVANQSSTGILRPSGTTASVDDAAVAQRHDTGGVNHEHDLIDTAEMYLRTVLELEEEGVVPLRARIAERLEQSVPTVSQTVARMERDGLLNVTGERKIELTPLGRSAATRVMRKHRLAECLLVDVIGLDWQLVHDEACRWEHVISETVERRLLEILGHPTESPYGNPIPGLGELGDINSDDFLVGLVALTEVPVATTSVVVRRIGEPIQSDTKLLTRLRRAGFRPNPSVEIGRQNGRVLIGKGNRAVELEDAVAAHVFVTAGG
jgi:DtxR family Mn-dependent transcriptional regulator